MKLNLWLTIGILSTARHIKPAARTCNNKGPGSSRRAPKSFRRSGGDGLRRPLPPPPAPLRPPAWDRVAPLRERRFDLLDGLGFSDALHRGDFARQPVE